MADATAEFRSMVLATSDLLLAAVGLAIVGYPAVTLGNALVGSPLDPATVRLLVGVPALGGAYPFVAGDWSYGTLWEFVLAFVGCAVAASALGMVTILALDLQFSGENPTPQVVVFALAYALAYLIVFRDGLRWAVRDG